MLFRSLLAPGGTLLLVAGDLMAVIGSMTSRDVRGGVVAEDSADMARLLDLVADGSLQVPLDQVLPMDDIVAAHARVDTGRKVGNIVVRPQERLPVPAAGQTNSERTS